MSPNQSKEIPSEYLVRSPGGLWVKALRTPSEVQLLWQARFEIEGREVRIIDANGEVESVADVATVEYGSPYRSAGSVEITNEMVEFCGVELFPKFIVAVMRHLACLLAGGYGEEPEDIVAGFNESEYIVRGCVYEFLEGMEPFVGLKKQKATILDDEDLTLQIQVNEDKFDQPLKTNLEKVSFLISTIPVI